ncbi:MAG TPA: hypothetical protein VMY18_04970, partial [Acidobacteriota bacterium]|nr:hypothetical protein [Acidobacteriota bacterium]
MVSSKRKVSTRAIIIRWVSRTFIMVLLIGVGTGLFLFRDTVFAALTDVFISTGEGPIPEEVLASREFQLEVPSFGEIIGMET